MSYSFKCLFLSIALLVACVAKADDVIVMARDNHLPEGLTAAIEHSGATVIAEIPQIGLVRAHADDAETLEALSKLRGVKAVIPDVTVQWLDPQRQVLLPQDFSDPPGSGDDDPFFDLQWGHDAVDSVEAWNAGFRGAGVRVAVLDSGIDAEHPDLAPNLNTALSTSFVPGEGFNIAPGFYFNHGTHVAGIVAAADNAFGSIGVAPEAEIVAVKVLSEFTGSGSFGGVIEGIVYAASIDSDVINMSLGANVPRNCTFPVLDDEGNPTGEFEHFPASDCAALITATQRAINFAVQQGTTVIAAAGNDGRDSDHDGSLTSVPSQLSNVIAVSATGPLGWALDPDTNLDVPAFYTNFGQSHINFAAPGGNVDFALLASGSLCIVAGVLQPCWVFDLAFSTISEGWGWAAGTSMATPHVSGVAAIIIGANGSDMAPHQVEAALRQGADDLGIPGKDDFFGSGRVDADDSL